jgi:hypothetical protein
MEPDLFNGYRVYFMGLKRAGLEVDHSLSYHAEVRNEWSHASTPHYMHSRRGQGKLYDYLPDDYCIYFHSLLNTHSPQYQTVHGYKIKRKAVNSISVMFSSTRYNNKQYCPRDSSLSVTNALQSLANGDVDLNAAQFLHTQLLRKYFNTIYSYLVVHLRKQTLSQVKQQ